MTNDIYQERYLKHQERKKEILQSNYGVKAKKHTDKTRLAFETVLKDRVSQRAFNREPVDIAPILELADYRPSSCDRKGVIIKVIESRDEKDLLSGLLVGGVGWVHRADKILLLIANMEAYKAPAERDFMHYLDAGVLAQTLYLIAESRNIGACYINPNIREENKDYFKQRFLQDNQVFCGAIALGHYDLKHENPTH